MKKFLKNFSKKISDVFHKISNIFKKLSQEFFRKLLKRFLKIIWGLLSFLFAPLKYFWRVCFFLPLGRANDWLVEHPRSLWISRGLLTIALGLLAFAVASDTFNDPLIIWFCTFLAPFFFVGYQLSCNAGPKSEKIMCKIARIMIRIFVAIIVAGILISNVSLAVIALLASFWLLIAVGLHDIGECLDKAESYLNDLADY